MTYINGVYGLLHGHFNSHAHVERDDFLWNADETKFHFNSHAHVERDVIIRLINDMQQISTHTLTWSVTTVPFVKYA